MKRSTLPLLAALAVGGLAACEDSIPTSLRDDLMPVEPRTVQVRVPWSSFASGLQVFGGFGRATDLRVGVLADDFAGILDARTLVRWTPFNFVVQVRDASGVNRPDSSQTFGGGRIVARFDTTENRPGAPVTVSAHAVRTPWHPPSATWELAVDTLDDRRAWPEAGGGPADPLGSAVWDPAAGDSIVIPVDSLTVDRWGDTLDATRGVRFDLETPGQRIELRSAVLRLDAHPESNPDTTIVVTAGARNLTFIYTPSPAETGGIRIGGTPSFRSVIEWSLSGTLDGPPELCAEVGCPFALEADRINLASLVLTTAESPAAFRPRDSIALDARAVIAPERLPKSPLGPSLALLTAGVRVEPAAFAGSPREVAVPVTPFVRSVVAQATGDTTGVSTTLALLSIFEPLSLEVADFVGPGQPGEPYLRLILTTADTVQLP